MVTRLAVVCGAALLLAIHAPAAEIAPPRYTATVVMPRAPRAMRLQVVRAEKSSTRAFSYELLPIWPAGKNVFAALPNYEPGTAQTVNVAATSMLSNADLTEARTRCTASGKPRLGDAPAIRD
jgi:hypothetical protein